MQQDVGLKAVNKDGQTVLSFEAGHWEQVMPYNRAIKFYLEEAGFSFEQQVDSGDSSGINSWLIHAEISQGQIDELLSKIKRVAKIQLSDDEEKKYQLIAEQVASEKPRRRANTA